MNNIENMSDQILKTAGIVGSAANGLKNAGKFIGRSAGGAVLGAGIGASKGVSANEKDPYASQETKELNILGGAAGGALVGGVAGGAGIGAVKKVGKGIAGIFKKSEMEVPNEYERGEKTDKDKAEVLESPNEEEQKRMLNSISKDDEKKQYYKDQIEKSASNFLKLSGYVQEIDCEVCGYSGQPGQSDGRCPECGSIGGVSPKYPEGRGREEQAYSREGRLNHLFEEIENARLNGREYY